METAWISIAIAALSLMFMMLAALLRVLIQSVRRQTRVDDKLGELAGDVEKLVQDKEKIHLAIFEQMKADRESTDKRLRYLEEFWMSTGRRVIRVLDQGGDGG